MMTSRTTMTETLMAKARLRRRRALSALARGAHGVLMSDERERPPRLTVAAAQRFMAPAHLAEKTPLAG